MNKKQLILFAKFLKIYNFLKFVHSIKTAFTYYSALIVSKVFFNFLVHRIPDTLSYKLMNTLSGPQSFYEKVFCNVLVKKLQMSDEETTNLIDKQIYDFWKSGSGLDWHIETNNDDYQSTFEEQAIFTIEKISELTKSHKIKNLCLIDISTGNGNFLNFLTKEVDVATKAIGFDINNRIIKHNKQKDDFKHIEFKHGLVQEHANYILNLSRDNSICFVSRKSLTFYNNKQFNELLALLNKVKTKVYFCLIETNNFNYKKNNETNYRDSPNFYAHNYPLIFKKNNWELMWSKKKYINFFINDHWVYCGFNTKNEERVT